jgi:hypothetical protein
LPLGFHLIKSLNFKYTLEWGDNADIKNVIKEIDLQYRNRRYKNEKISISNSWFFEPSINYYREVYSMKYLEPANRNDIDKNADFIYCTKQDRDELNLNNGYSFFNYNTSGTVLIEKSNCK